MNRTIAIVIGSIGLGTSVILVAIAAPRPRRGFVGLRGFGRTDRSDKELIERIQEGDRSAFDELYKKNFDAVYRVALSKMRDPEDARDVAQDAFAKAHREITAGRFRAESSFFTWMYRITANMATSALRKRTRSGGEFTPELEREMERVQPVMPTLPASVTRRNPEETRVLEDLVTKLTEVIEGLPTRQRQVYVLNKIMGLSRLEIAEKLNIKGERKWLYLARKAVASQMRPELEKVFGKLTDAEAKQYLDLVASTMSEDK